MLTSRCGYRLVVVGLAASLLACAPNDPAQTLYLREVTGNVFDTTPVYGDVVPLRHRRGGFEYKCSECHTDFESPRASSHPEGEHVELAKRFDHGGNVYCLNCHHQTNRDVFADFIGGEIPNENSTQLCAKCHGPMHRDWSLGIHGRQNGYWDASMGPQTKLQCVQCHDPHHPAFPPMKPDPPSPRSRFSRVTGKVHP